jgi:leucyl/phenylalanyl-tRNA--protein transferase
MLCFFDLSRHSPASSGDGGSPRGLNFGPIRGFETASMPVFFLPENEVVFPPPNLARADGLLALGGDLRPDRLLAAYRRGIFPWYMEGEPILWWSPDPRLVLYPEALHVPRRLGRLIRQGRYSVTVDVDFPAVIRACAATHLSRDKGTWILPEMVDAYIALHEAGYAHSVEVWKDGRLVGGLYGVSLGAAFFGESMFTRVRDASKVGLVRLVKALGKNGFTLVDCQVTTKHMIRFGARDLPREQFLSELRLALSAPTLEGRWTLDAQTAALSGLSSLRTEAKKVTHGG